MSEVNAQFFLKKKRIYFVYLPARGIICRVEVYFKNGKL